MTKKICVLTATRAEYGLLKPIITRLMLVPEFDIRVVATGAHLSPEFGLTYQEIELDGIPIDEKIEILLSSDTSSAISKSMGMAMIGFADYFAKANFDLLIVLGDRYETLAVCCAAMIQRIPIAHLYGGETTEGAIDESIRHAISKLSYLHFTSTDEYRNRVIQMGEQPERVFCVGAIGIENIINTRLLNKTDLEEAISFRLDKPYAVITFHPETLGEISSADQFQELLKMCHNHADMKYIFSKANADTDGRIINQMIDTFVSSHDNCIAFSSLGMLRYLSTMKYCELVIGNSSSGILEAPSFGIPTINIGGRQKGRIQGDSIINCEPDSAAIEIALKLALSSEFKEQARKTVNPYGDGNTSSRIVDAIFDIMMNGKIDLKKRFYNCEVK